MSNFAIDININAPALVGAIEHLCTALGKPVMLEAKPAGTAAKLELVQQPVQTTPVDSGTGPAACTGADRSTAGTCTGRTGSSADRQDLHHG